MRAAAEEAAKASAMKINLSTLITIGLAAAAAIGFVYRLQSRLDLLEWKENYYHGAQQPE